MKIVICKQNLYGGTDKLLERLENWLKQNNYAAEFPDSSFNTKEKRFDLAIVPSSQMGDLWKLRKNGIGVDRILVWILGMGAFRESYFNETQNTGLKKLPINLLRREADNTLIWLYKHNSIIFTDEVGAYNTFKNCIRDYKKNLDANLIPIAIEIDSQQKQLQLHENETIKIAWVGRVCKDFKFIPLQYLLKDIDKWILCSNKKIELTIIGNGDAIEEIKEICKKVKFPVRFIAEIEYKKLGTYICNNIDVLVAMGTSALDGAKVGCPTMVVTPVRECDSKEVYYRWIYESKGYSLGEFPGIDIETEQVRKTFNVMMNEYFEKNDHGRKSYEYAQNFEINNVFQKLMFRKQPLLIDKHMWTHIKKFHYLKTCKEMTKKIIESRNCHDKTT